MDLMQWAYNQKQQGVPIEEIRQELIKQGLNITYEALKKRLQRMKKQIIYEDKKEYSDNDIEDYINKMIALQEASEKLNTKQVKATIRIDDDKPIGIAYWGDWHIGCIGTDYKALEEDSNRIVQTDGLFYIGAGDYKDNYISNSPIGGQFGQIIQPGMQDIVVMRYIEKTADKCLALLKGCHDHWTQKQADQDFVSTLCEKANCVNLWHGGEITIKLANQSYLFRCRHKYPYQSSLNLENAMRRIMEKQGPCDVAAEAHWHEPYVMDRHLMGEYRVMMRSGSYKKWDDYGQQLAGYKGKRGVPVVILFPDKHKMLPVRDLDMAIEILQAFRR